MPREEHAALLAPLADLAVVGVAVELGQRLVEVEPNARALDVDVEEEVRQVGPELVAVALAEAPEHVLRPGQDRHVLPAQEVVHRRLVRVEARNLRAEAPVRGGHVRVVAEAQELRRGLRVERVDVVVGGLLEDVEDAPVARRDLPRDHLLEREVRRQVDELALARDRERRDGRRALKVQVAAVLTGQVGEPRATRVEGDALDVPLREVRPRLQYAVVGRPARPVHLVVDPGAQAEPLCLLDREPDPLEIGVADVGRLQSVAAVEDDPRKLLVAQLAELPAHVVGIDLPVEEPERQDPVLARRLAEGSPIATEPGPRNRRRAHTDTVALTKPAGFSTATANARLTSSSGKRWVTRSSRATRPDVSNRMPMRIPRRIVATSRKCALTSSKAM